MIEGKTVLVTGGAGFIGSNLTDALLDRGVHVRVLDNLATGKREFVNPRAEFHELDIRNLEAIKPVFAGVDTVFHLAALPRIQFSIDYPVVSNETNVTGTVNVLLAARDARVRRVIYSSSSSAYGNQETLPLHEGLCPKPLSPYALQKFIGEEYCRIFSGIFSLQTVSLRYFNVYGPRQSAEGAYATVIPIFLGKKSAGEPLPITSDGEQTRDFTHVSDVARANMLAAESEGVGAGEVINIGGGKEYSVNAIAKMIGGETVSIPARPGEVRCTCADTRRAKELLGWEPQVPLEQGLRELMK
ncbi:MAG: SDR family oxidoreductase [Patescibacteria group bacterium]